MTKLPPPTTFEFKGQTFKQGDVIVNRKENLFAVLAEIETTKIEPPFPFLPTIEIAAPKFYVAYLGENNENKKVITRVLKPDCGIGRMEDFELATDEEIKKFEQLLLGEGHIRYKYPEISFEYIPVVGDMVAAWNGDSCERAVVGIVEEVLVTNEVVLNDGLVYTNSSLFCDVENFKLIIN